MLRDAAVELAVAMDAAAVVEALDRAVARLTPPGSSYEVRIALPEDLVTGSAYQPGQGEATPLVPITVDVRDVGQVGILLVDHASAAQPRLRCALEALSAQAAQAIQRIRLAEEVSRHRNLHQIETLLDQTGDVVLILDGQSRIRYASPSAGTVFGTSALRDVRLLDFIDAKQRAAAEFLLRHVRSGGAGPRTGRADWTIRSVDGSTPLVEVCCRQLWPDESGQEVALTLRDVTAQRRLEHELTERKFHDQLTGLPNRALLVERTEHAIATSAGITAILLIDIDDFGSVNDTFGHAVGDQVLTMAGRRLLDAVGPAGVVARVSGDEFAALIRDVDTAADVEQTADRICHELAAPIRTSIGTVVVCSASVGIATTLRAGSAQELLRNANLALHSARSAGAGRWRRYEPSMTDRLRQSQLRSALAHAVDEGALRLEYQPIVALATRRAVGCEALLRWQHPTRGRLLPGEFIDIAEESGLIVPIGEWVLATAMATAMRWCAEAADRAPYVSVNVSAQQFRSDGFVETVRRLLAQTGLPTRRLVLEITESLFLRDDDKVWDALRLLRGDGVRIAIDDFGTGYSALGYLRQTPLDIVKLDRLFVGGLDTSRRQRDLVEGIVRLTRTLGLDAVAEGIETEQQLHLAAATGCAYGQGYLFSAPMAPSETLRWLSAGHGVAPS
ncbi:putative bifunctional diguanylate cyclase/phosphodiesterase [Catellatospora tritici]|uniref:putative bifunctional diguanylate cyclase/phosphodiesterase n=1 Tax=Catellatospora tritici TaxID=2851566 RepID=UPI001C2D45A3|nr:EAL domain-containing protein [Catellatospora tritici]MBV1856415.1 EAL domain-containing protein [Catellatospora tritici]